MKIGDITKPIIALLDDVRSAEEYLDANDSQFARRAYVRSLFAFFEGSVWILKQVVLQAAKESKRPLFSTGEYSLLRDVSYDLKANGDIRKSDKFLRLPENLRFTHKIVNRVFSGSVDLQVGTKPWNDFLHAIEVRNRVTHPKRLDEFLISDSEITLCRSVCSWYNDVVVHALLSPILENPKKKEAEPGAAPNDGPATSVADSTTIEGRHR